MGNVHESLLKSLNQRKLSIFWCTRFLQNSWQNRVGGTQLRHALTSLFRIPARTFESQCIMYVFGHQGAIIFIFIPAVLGICSTDSFCSGIRTVIQQIEWPASCASTTSVSIPHTFYKKENWIDITSLHSMFHLTRQQAPLSFGFILLLLRGFRQEEEKSSRFEGCNCVLMQSVGDLGKVITDQVCCPIWDLSEGCSSRIPTWPILILVSLGWRWRTTINEGVGPADKVGHLNIQNCLLLQASNAVIATSGNDLTGPSRPNIDRSEEIVSGTTTTAAALIAEGHLEF